MKVLKVLSVLVVLAGVVALALVGAPSVFGRFDSPVLAQGRLSAGAQNRAHDRAEAGIFGARGGRIGVSARDLEAAEADRQKVEGGVFIEDVQPHSPAAKAGLKPSDVLVELDGERVRGARQFSRLVHETPPGRTVKATIVRDGRRSDVQLTPAEGGGPDVVINGDRLRDRLGNLADRLPSFDLDLDLDLPGMMASPRRLGVSVQQMTDQLANYFGAKEGVLVVAVTDGSAAAKAGLKAGDVITSIDSQRVRSRQDLTRALRDVTDDAEVTIGIVRDKKESSLKARLEPRQPTRSRRSV